MRPCWSLLTLVLLCAGCIHLKVDPVEVHATVDVNVKVDQALDNFFGDLDKKSTTLGTPAAPAAKKP